MEYQFSIQTAKLREMCKRSSYAISTDKSNQKLRSYHIRMSLGELEVTCTDGFRLCYQTFMIPGTEEQEPWSVAIEKDVLEAALKACYWPEVKVIANPVFADMLWKVSLCNASNLEEYIQVEGNHGFKADMTRSIARSKPSIAEATVSAKSFIDAIEAEAAQPPVTIKGLDNDSIIFLYPRGDTVKVRKGGPIEAEGPEYCTIQKKFISESIKSIGTAGLVKVRAVEAAKLREMMLILEDSNSGHVMMPVTPKYPKELKALSSGDYFRALGFAATFKHIKDGYGNSYSYIVSGEKPDALESYRSLSSEDCYHLAEDTKVFIESYDERKMRWKKEKNRK